MDLLNLFLEKSLVIRLVLIALNGAEMVGEEAKNESTAGAEPAVEIDSPEDSFEPVGED